MKPAGNVFNKKLEQIQLYTKIPKKHKSKAKQISTQLAQLTPMQKKQGRKRQLITTKDSKVAQVVVKTFLSPFLILLLLLCSAICLYCFFSLFCGNIHVSCHWLQLFLCYYNPFGYLAGFISSFKSPFQCRVGNVAASIFKMLTHELPRDLVAR